MSSTGTGKGVKADKAKAIQWTARACDQGDLQPCVDVTPNFVKGLDVPVDYNRGRTMSEKACDGGNAERCYNLGVTHLRGLGVPLDKAKGKGFFEKSCKTGMQRGCESVGSALYIDRDHVVLLAGRRHEQGDDDEEQLHPSLEQDAERMEGIRCAKPPCPSRVRLTGRFTATRSLVNLSPRTRGGEPIPRPVPLRPDGRRAHAHASWRPVVRLERRAGDALTRRKSRSRRMCGGPARTARTLSRRARARPSSSR